MNIDQLNDEFLKDELTSIIEVMLNWKNGKEIDADDVHFIRMRMELLQKQISS